MHSWKAAIYNTILSALTNVINLTRLVYISTLVAQGGKSKMTSNPYECLANESKIIEKHTEQRIQNDHRMDNFILLVYVVLLSLSVITIWAFKHRRFRYIHETGLSVVYGLIVGLIFRYAIKSPNYSVESHVFPRKSDEACGGRLPPERLIVEFPVRDQHGKFNLSMSFRYKFEQQSDFDSLINNKATFDPEFFFNVLLPPIIFSAGYSMKRGYFFKNIGAVLTYAFCGTLLSALVVGIICYGFTRGITSLSQTLLLSDCLLFGAIISATDPVTVLAIFSDLKVDVNLYALVFGESVLNDALAIALAQSIEKYGSLSVGNFDSQAFLSSVLNFFVMFGGSFAIGVFIGCVTSLLTKFTHIKEHPLLETTLFVLMSYSTFLFAEAVGFTGIVSVLFCGITQAHYTYNNLSNESKVWTKSFFELLNFLSENFVFAYIGVSTFTFRHHYWDARFVFIALFSCVIARAVSVYPLTAFINFCRTYHCSCSANCLKKRFDSHSHLSYSADKSIIPGSSFLSNSMESGDVIVSSTGDKRKSVSNKITLNFQHMIFFSGLRGAMAFSLAIRNTSSEIRRMFFSTVIVIVMTTVLLGGCFAISLLHRLKIPVGSDSNNQNQPHAETNDSVDDHSFCGSRWMSFDKFYLKPLLTHSTPPLTESLPSCCYKFAKLLTTYEQSSETFANNDGNNSYSGDFKRDSTTVFYSNEKASISPILSMNAVRVQPVQI
ncbi:Sodium/hydrogen exchanger 9 [Schistosoma japonicum]|nr:Sodium/hydrogen exchanger 9 [Schistosoma japonicum]